MATEMTETDLRALITTLATEKKDFFGIKVLRRRGAGAAPDILATFADGTSMHIASPETWLPQLAGGGAFTLHVTHESLGPLKWLGNGLQVQIDGVAPRKVDPDVVRRADWKGPMDMTYPQAAQAVPQSGMEQGRFVSAMDQPVQQMGSMMTPAPQKPVASNDPVLAMLAQAQASEQKATEVARRAEFQRDLEGVRRENDIKLADAKRQHDEVLNELRRMRETAALPPRTPDKPLSESLAAIIAAVTPLVAPLLAGMNDTRIKMMEIEAKRSADQLAMQQAANQRMEQLINMLLNKPAVDPVLLSMISKEKETNPQMAQMMTSMGGMMNMFIQSITAATDAGLIGQPQGGGWQDVVKEVAGAAQGFFGMLQEQHKSVQAQLTAGQRPARPMQAAPGTPQQLPQRPAPARPVQPPMSALKRLDAMVRSHHNPAQTAAFFLEAIQRDGEVRQNFVQSGNDIEEFFKFHWGAWALSNVAAHAPYIDQLRKAVEMLGARAGMVQPESASEATVEVQQQPVHPAPSTPPSSYVTQAMGNGNGHGEALVPVDPGDEGEQTPNGAGEVEILGDEEEEGEEEIQTN